MGSLGLGNNVAGIVFNMAVGSFAAVVAIAIGMLVYAAGQLKKAETATQSSEKNDTKVS